MFLFCFTLRSSIPNKVLPGQPHMASLIKKIKGGSPYYYIAVAKRVNGKPRIVHPTYLGSVDRILANSSGRLHPCPTGPRHSISASPKLSGRPPKTPLPVPPSTQYDPCAPRLRRLALPLGRRLPPHLQPLFSDHDRRLVREHNSAPPVGLHSRQLFRPSFSGPLRLDQCRAVPQSGEQEEPDELLAAQDRLLQAFRDHKLVSQRALAYDTINFLT